jgi:uncharacterized protein (DUF983 family)
MGRLDQAMTLDFWKSALFSRCPVCFKGKLFDGFLSITPQCRQCGTDFASAATGDGPAVFVILVAGAICVPFIIIAQLAFNLPIWLVALFGLPLTGAVCVGLLRPFKSILFALQWRFRAGEGVVAGSVGKEKDHG